MATGGLNTDNLASEGLNIKVMTSTENTATEGLLLNADKMVPTGKNTTGDLDIEAVDSALNTAVMSDEEYDAICTMCTRKKRHREAKQYCVDCDDYYCLSCVKVHDDVPSLSGHRILDNAQFNSRFSQNPAPSRSKGTLPPAPTERCDKHSHFYIDMYCQDHDKVGCVICMFSEHSQCQDKFYIPKYLQANTVRYAPTDIQLLIDTAAKSLNEFGDNLKFQKQSLLAAEAECMEKVNDFREKTNQKLDQLQKNSLDEINNIFKASVDQTENALHVIEQNKSKVRSFQSNLISNLDKNISQNFVNAKKGQTVVKSATRSIEERRSMVRAFDIRFNAEQSLPALLEDMHALGRISQMSYSKETFPVTSNLGQERNHQFTETKTMRSVENNPAETDALFKVTRSEKYAANVKSDTKECNIVSACMINDDTLLLSDLNNQKLKRLDGCTYTVTDYCDLPSKPWQVCPISALEVAVAGDKTIYLISLTGKMSITRKLETDFDCIGLAYADGNLYITDVGTSVYMYNFSDSKLKQIVCDKSRQKLFTSIRSLAVSKDGSKIYVSDFFEGLLVLSSNAQVVRKCNDPRLQKAFGCYFTDSGSLFLVGFSSKNVLRVTSDGEIIGEVLKSDENTRYQAVCCNTQMSKMVLSSMLSNEIEVYDLKVLT